ncbi:adenosylcobinamide-GDP ribazoletransferase [Aliiroseovarius zhejiangensis]|uniref:Adenosylcobinamide-GDP ribazoletransferase n=1 Tax=Aliiroseovarius zhejiangensis TaxID=1632025 RepID=A0ABQ3IV80_9RHOB|nr:adenosylcobinamide-GDP ribazoletransferase [Aliiroseovarius zhejiangensis]GHE94806.1 adenosylcobinamide-GDP ribazoletransferase [Aliiroseovarius zhejiangensis]
MTKDDIRPQDDEALATRVDLPAAIGLLTRLPVRLDTGAAVKRGARSAWAWPLVGLIPAGLGAAVGLVALGLDLPPLWAALAALVVQIMMTGAMHEDGLADTADGLWGGATRARRLEIMKDSRIGAYGVIALVLSLGLRAAALAVILPSEGAFWALLTVGAVSRTPMVALLAMLPNARSGGLSQTVGRVPRQTLLLALGCTLLVALILTPYALVALFFWTGLSSLLLAALARQKIGGQTGDILGASQQIAEIAALAVFAALLT